MQNEELQNLRHSLAHLLAAAVMELWPDTKRTIGPAIDDGFYYDFEFTHPISDDDLPVIEARMRALLPSWTGFTRREVSADEAREAYKGNPYKRELIDEFANQGQTLTFYTSGSYTDLCRGGHADNMSAIDPASFKLTKVAGAYWRGNEKNPMLTRIYGYAFSSKAELDAYVAMMEEAKKRDHRKLGTELDLFAFSPLVGSGLPLFTPKGVLLRQALTDFVWELMKPYGYERVWIPHLAKSDLYKTSGHWDKFEDDLFHVSSKKTEEAFVLKPMNCPHHTQIYASKPRSYRDLPLRYSEVTTVYRDENTGQLQGLSRVRSITQDDAHVFCRPDQIHDEALAMYRIIEAFYAAFKMPLRVRLSIRDPKKPEKYLGGDDVWSAAESTLAELMKEVGREVEVGEGEAAFYGPKLDFIAKDAIGREWQLATIQLDFVQPERFGLEYADAEGGRTRPVMIHRAILGSVERFLGILIEHFAGDFPLWLAPVQIRVLPVADRHDAFANTLVTELLSYGLRAEADVTVESVGKKIRNAEQAKMPIMLVVGDKEVDGGMLTVRRRGSKDQETMAKDAFIAGIVAERDAPRF
jgi:threonyl-tRNA synthetase